MGICDCDGVGDNKHQPTAITSAILELITKSGCGGGGVFYIENILEAI